MKTLAEINAANAVPKTITGTLRNGEAYSVCDNCDKVGSECGCEPHGNFESGRTR